MFLGQVFSSLETIFSYFIFEENVHFNTNKSTAEIKKTCIIVETHLRVWSGSLVICNTLRPPFLYYII